MTLNDLKSVCNSDVVVYLCTDEGHVKIQDKISICADGIASVDFMNLEVMSIIPIDTFYLRVAVK